jgi:hypothetical protein
MDPLRQMTGASITSLMGMDILRRFSVEFRYAEGKVIFDTGPLISREVSLHADLVMGIPIISVDICNGRSRMCLDIGAKHTYLDSRHTHGRTPDATEQDFYQGIGHFQTPVFTLHGAVGGDLSSDVLATSLPACDRS